MRLLCVPLLPEPEYPLAPRKPTRTSPSAQVGDFMAPRLCNFFRITAAAILLLALALKAEAGDEVSSAPLTCSCDDLAACTAVDDIPILFAPRDIVRSALKQRGLIAVSEDDSRILDSYQARDSEYTALRAFFDEDRQLADLDFQYPANRLEQLLADDPPLPGAKSGRARGGFGAEEDSSREWLTRDGVTIRLSRKRGEDFVVMSFESTAARSHLDAFEKRPRNRQIDWVEFLKEDGLVQDDSDGSAPEGLSTNSLQGHLTFRTTSPILKGKTELSTDFCSSTTDLDTGSSPPPDFAERFEISGYRKPVNLVEVEKLPDGSLHVVLRVRDNGGSRYDFDHVVAGRPARGEVHGDCRAKSITLTYEPTSSPTCLNASLKKWSLSRIVADLQKRGLEFDHLELLHGTETVTLHGPMDANVMVSLLADISNLYFDRVVPNHFSLRAPQRASTSSSP